MHHIAQATLHGMSRVPVGGCPCGRMLAVAPFKIREQGLAPTRNLTLREQGLAPTQPKTTKPQLGLSRVPVGGCSCGRMLAVAPFKIREQGLAPTGNLKLREQGLATAKPLKDSYAL